MTVDIETYARENAGVAHSSPRAEETPVLITRSFRVLTVPLDAEAEVLPFELISPEYVSYEPPGAPAYVDSDEMEETLEILADENAMNLLAKAREDLAAGRMVDDREVRGRDR